MNAPRTFSTGLAALVLLVLFLASASAEAALRIEKAYCGAETSWRDVTIFLRSKVRGDTLSVKIPQPFEEIGGDPAPGHVKYLIIDYRLNGSSYRLLLTEGGPDSFDVQLPSSEAAAPGQDPEATALMRNAESKGKGGYEWQYYLCYGITVVSVIWAIAASIQVLKLKKRLAVNP